jgi:hypothetical protein
MVMNHRTLDLKNLIFWVCISFLVFLLGATCHSSAQTQPTASLAPPQSAFESPEIASAALIEAADKFDVDSMKAMLGPASEDLVASEDPVQDKLKAKEFVELAAKKKGVELKKGGKEAVLLVGPDDWPLPIPMVKRGGKWYFDAKQGRKEILARRIGANELDAITICRGFDDAQKAYASEIHDDSGVYQYAQRIISTPGKRDGLYWKNEDGTPGGPISEVIARAIAEGYSTENQKPTPFHGYYFKILKGRGPSAPGGAVDFIISGMMIGGYALAAVPAEYGVTGIKSFIVSYEGTVYQRDLGPDSLKMLSKIDTYNPDKAWTRTDDQWPVQLATSSPAE